jgi:uncharacterized protein (DUF362 family)
MIYPFNSSPLLDDPQSPTVDIGFGSDAYEVTRRVLASRPLNAVNGARVLLKPNAGRMAPPISGIDTHPDVVAAAIDAFMDAGANVTVGDSPIVGVRALEALEMCGIAEVARRRNIKLLDLDLRRPVVLQLEQPRVLRQIKVCADVLEHDLVVSIPVMKTHMHTGVSLAVKNMKGCLWRRSKVELHMLDPVEDCTDRPLDIAIADMATVLRPHFAIVDGIVGQEGLGPSAGSKKPFGVIVVSADAFAADSVACHLMGRDASQIAHLRLGAERRLGVIRLTQMRIAPDDWASHAEPFEEPPRELSLNFPGVRVLDQNSCSACQSTLLMFLKRYGENLFEYFGDRRPVEIAIGKGHDTLPAGTLCLGNCTIKLRKTGPFVPGCPPVASTIHNVLTGTKTKDD